MRYFVVLALGIYIGFIIPHEGELCPKQDPPLDCPKLHKIQKGKDELTNELIFEHFEECVDKLIKCEKSFDQEKSKSYENCYVSNYTE